MTNDIIESATDAIAHIDFQRAIAVIEEGLAEAVAFNHDTVQWQERRLEIGRLMRLQQARLVQLKHMAREIEL